MSIKEKINNDLKEAMRTRDSKQIRVLRLINAAIKQVEVDEHLEVDDNRLLAILDKMAKQRKESIEQYQTANREELVKQEQYELDIIKQYLPEPLSQQEIEKKVEEAIDQIGAQSMSDMGKVMGRLKPELQGKADLSEVSKLIKSKLS